MFTYPLPRTPRVALLRNGLDHGRSVRYFDESAPDFIERVSQFRPESFAGSLDQLMRIARPNILRALDIRAIVVLAPAGSTPLSAAERDELWRRFGAPVFEQQLTSDGELVATECEAHDGLHVMDPRAALAGAALDDSPCACGKTTPRIRRDHSDSDAAAA
jgi:hypothetical protein